MGRIRMARSAELGDSQQVDEKRQSQSTGVLLTQQSTASHCRATWVVTDAPYCLDSCREAGGSAGVWLAVDVERPLLLRHGGQEEAAAAAGQQGGGWQGEGQQRQHGQDGCGLINRQQGQIDLPVSPRALASWSEVLSRLCGQSRTSWLGPRVRRVPSVGDDGRHRGEREKARAGPQGGKEAGHCSD